MSASNELGKGWSMGPETLAGEQSKPLAAVQRQVRTSGVQRPPKKFPACAIFECSGKESDT